ncbi:MAG: GAF domain-containing protein [Marmoricola sp.]
MDAARHDAVLRLHEVMTRINAGQNLDAVLQAIADGVTEVSGFEVAAINVLHPNGEFEVVALGGDDGSIADMLHGRYPSDVVLKRNELGEQWGMFRFVPHTLAIEDPPEGFRVLDFEPIDHPDAWDPLDELSVTLHSPTGKLIGIMYVDRPTDGLRPNPETIEIMEMFAVQAGFAINHAQQRERLSEQVWLAGMVRSVIETTAGRGDLDETLDNALSTLQIELSASAAWLDMFPSDDPGHGTRSRGDEGVFTVSAALGAHGPALARDSLHRAEAVVIDHADLVGGHRLFTPTQCTWLQRAFEIDGVQSLVLAPLSLDDDVAGQLVLMRAHHQPWTDAEGAAVRDVGRELGWAIGRARSRRREALASEALDRTAREQRELLASLAEEVSVPLAAVDAHLTGSGLPPDHPARIGMETFWGLFDQVSSLIAFERPEHVPVPELVDMTAMLQVQWSHAESMAADREVRLLPLDAEPGQHAWADSEQLEWLTRVLLEDVVLTSAPRSSVRISVATLHERVLISCQVSGLDATAAPAPAATQEHLPRWWRAGANLLLSRQNGTLTSRSGPLGRRVVSMSLPVPPTRTGLR